MQINSLMLKLFVDMNADRSLVDIFRFVQKFIAQATVVVGNPATKFVDQFRILLKMGGEHDMAWKIAQIIQSVQRFDIDKIGVYVLQGLVMPGQVQNGLIEIFKKGQKFSSEAN
ncbi:hypothetical protein D3C81_1678220 [compost metagenome]